MWPFWTMPTSRRQLSIHSLWRNGFSGSFSNTDADDAYSRSEIADHSASANDATNATPRAYLLWSRPVAVGTLESNGWASRKVALSRKAPLAKQTAPAILDADAHPLVANPISLIAYNASHHPVVAQLHTGAISLRCICV